MKVTHIRKAGKRKWVVTVDDKFLWLFPFRMVYGGTFDSFGVTVTWRNLTHEAPVPPIIGAWLTAQINEHLRERADKRQQKRDDNGAKSD